MSSSWKTRRFTRAATIRAMLLVLVGALGLQFSVVIAVGFFSTFGALGTSGVRMLIAAVILLAFFRPRLRGRSRREWAGIVLYGVAMAAMSAFLYLAFDRLPIGVATTVDFLGPCVVALLASRRVREGALALVALLGVGLIVGFGGALDPLGLVFAALAGVAFGLYTLLAGSVGQSDGGLPSVALSVAVAAILTLPFSVPTLPLIRVEHLLPLVASALLGTALAFTVDTFAGRLTSARVLGVFFAFDPVVATIVGTIFLGQVLTPVALAGVVLVVAAGAGIVWFSGGHGPAAEAPQESPPEAHTPPRKLRHVTAESDAGIETLEVERKYEVAVDARLPTAERFAAVGFVAADPVTYHLVARYFDTPDEALARAGIAVRVREGGSDAGWHVKRREPDGVRELHWPLATEMPSALLAELRERVGESAARVAPRAVLETERTVVVLRDAAGAGLVELADDRVRATDVVDGVHRAWREWEAELLPGAQESQLDAVDPVLRDAGAVPSASPAKIARATGKLIPLALARGADSAELAALKELDAADQAAARRLGA